MKLSMCFAALPFIGLASAGFAQTTGKPIPIADSEAPDGVEAAREQLLDGTVVRALRDAEFRLGNGQLDDAIAMAWAGLEQAANLPQSQRRSSLIESLMLVVIDARVQAELSRRTPADTATDSSPVADVPQRDPTTGLSTVKPPDRPSPLAEALEDLGEPPDLPERLIAYPPNWQSTARRGGSNRTPILYESEPFQDESGETLQTVVYDVRSLILPTPSLECVPLHDLYESTRTAADRDALRRGSAIFNGYAHDLDAGIPLLGGFGGPCSWPDGVGAGQSEMAELVRLIEDITSR